jgi:hypothetical protein
MRHYTFFLIALFWCISYVSAAQNFLINHTYNRETRTLDVHWQCIVDPYKKGGGKKQAFYVLQDYYGSKK